MKLYNRLNSGQLRQVGKACLSFRPCIESLSLSLETDSRLQSRASPARSRVFMHALWNVNLRHSTPGSVYTQDDELLAYQTCFDLVENELQSFLTKVGSFFCEC